MGQERVRESRNTKKTKRESEIREERERHEARQDRGRWRERGMGVRHIKNNQTVS